MPESLCELLEWLNADPAYRIVWVGAMVAIVQRRGSADWRALGSMAELYTWEMDNIEYFARKPKRGEANV